MNRVTIAAPKKQIAIRVGAAFAVYGAAIPVAELATAIVPSDAAGDAMFSGVIVLLMGGCAFVLGCCTLAMASRRWAEYGLGMRLLAIAPVAFPIILFVVGLVVSGNSG